MNQVCERVQKYGPLLARILLAQLFVVSGVGKITAFQKTAAYMAAKGMPMSEVLLVLTIVLEVGGGLALILGWRVRWIAAAFFVFTLLAAVIFHPFWSVEPASISGHLNNFMKNLAIMGGMLYVMAYGAGPLSLGSGEPATAGSAGGKRKQQG